jgi:hypothetical protein
MIEDSRRDAIEETQCENENEEFAYSALPGST